MIILGNDKFGMKQSDAIENNINIGQAKVKSIITALLHFIKLLCEIVLEWHEPQSCNQQKFNRSKVKNANIIALPCKVSCVILQM